MDREVAIELLKQEKGVLVQVINTGYMIGIGKEYTDKGRATIEALDLAIEALKESQTTHDQMDACYLAKKQAIDIYKAIESLPPVTPKPVCEDAISRQQAIEVISNCKGICDFYDDVRTLIDNIPPVEAVEVKTEQFPPKISMECMNDGMVLIPQHDWIEMQKKLEGYVSTETMIVDGEETEIDPVSYEIGYTHGQTAPTVSEDCISRQQAIEALGEEPDIAQDTDEEWAEHDSWVIHRNAIASLPPVTPTERTGEWIKATGVAPPEFTGRYVCSSCGDYALMDMPYGSKQELSHFCPNCGAQMKGDTE